MEKMGREMFLFQFLLFHTLLWLPKSGPDLWTFGTQMWTHGCFTNGTSKSGGNKITGYWWTIIIDDQNQYTVFDTPNYMEDFLSHAVALQHQCASLQDLSLLS